MQERIVLWPTAHVRGTPSPLLPPQYRRNPLHLGLQRIALPLEVRLVLLELGGKLLAEMALAFDLLEAESHRLIPTYHAEGRHGDVLP